MNEATLSKKNDRSLFHEGNEKIWENIPALKVEMKEKMKKINWRSLSRFIASILILLTG